MHNHLIEDPIYLIRAIGGYFFALLIIRMMGKRSIGELGAFDFVLMAGIGDIMSFIILEKKVPFHDGVLVLIMLVVLEKLLSYLTFRSRKLGKLIEGRPTYLIDEGDVLEKNLEKEKINMYDMRQELRKYGIDNESDVKKALIEACGKFTVVLKEAEEPVRRKDLGIYNEGDSPQYLDKRFAEIRKEIDRLNVSLNNLIIEVRKMSNKE